MQPIRAPERASSAPRPLVSRAGSRSVNCGGSLRSTRTLAQTLVDAAGLQGARRLGGRTGIVEIRMGGPAGRSS